MNIPSKHLYKYMLVNSFSSVQSLSRARILATPWIAASQASLSITNSRSSLKLMPVESVMPSSHLILCRPLLLLPPIPPSIRVFSNESTLRTRCPKYWSFSFSISQAFQWTPRTDLLFFSNNLICLLVVFLSCILGGKKNCSGMIHCEVS